MNADHPNVGRNLTSHRDDYQTHLADPVPSTGHAHGQACQRPQELRMNRTNIQTNHR